LQRFSPRSANRSDRRIGIAVIVSRGLAPVNALSRALKIRGLPEGGPDAGAPRCEGVDGVMASDAVGAKAMLQICHFERETILSAPPASLDEEIATRRSRNRRIAF